MPTSTARRASMSLRAPGRTWRRPASRWAPAPPAPRTSTTPRYSGHQRTPRIPGLGPLTGPSKKWKPMHSNATQTAQSQPAPAAADILAAAPPLRHEPAARERIRAANVASGRRIAVLDDDPTGSQTVHDVAVVTVFEDAEYAAGLAEPGSTCFVLTNTRSLPEDAAVALNSTVAGSLFALGKTLDAPIEVVSRGDSTLRGHILSEIAAIGAARRRVTGTGFDGVLLVPAYFEAGRFTAGDIHWANVAGELVPVGHSEFARDATFGYTSSNLREFIAEKSTPANTAIAEDGQNAAAAGDYTEITPDEVHSISLSDIRPGGPERVAEILAGVTGGAFVVVNATDYADLEVVVLGLLRAQARGKSFVSVSYTHLRAHETDSY